MKPYPKTKTYYDYRECIDYIAKKYGFNPDDYYECKKYIDNAFKLTTLKFNDDTWAHVSPVDANPQQLEAINYFNNLYDQQPKDVSFWSSICDNYSLNNGDFFTFLEDDWEDAEPWEKTIVQYLINEFGDAIEFKVWW